MSDSLLESVKEKVKDIRSEVSEDIFDTAWKNVGKRRVRRRGFGIVAAAAAASAAILAIVLTVSPKDSLVPELPGDILTQSNDVKPVSEETEIVAKPVNILPSERPAPFRQLAVNQSDSASGQPSSITNGHAEVTEKNPSQTEEAKQEVGSGKPHEEEHFAQIIEPKRSQARQKRLHLSVSGSTLGTGNSLNRDTPLHSIVAIIHNNKPEVPAVIGQIEIGGNDIVDNVSYNHRMPISLRLMFSYDISDRLSAEGGISYSYHNSSAVFYPSESLRQQLHFIGVPIGLRYDFMTFKHSSFYAKIGGEVEKCISGVLFNPTNNNVDKLEIEPLFWSAEASFGAQVEIVGPLFLFAESGCSYHFDNGTGTITYYGAHPLMFSLQGGLRIEL